MILTLIVTLIGRSHTIAHGGRAHRPSALCEQKVRAVAEMRFDVVETLIQDSRASGT